jgi:hypothetical protein
MYTQYPVSDGESPPLCQAGTDYPHRSTTVSFQGTLNVHSWTKCNILLWCEGLHSRTNARPGPATIVRGDAPSGVGE